MDRATRFREAAACANRHRERMGWRYPEAHGLASHDPLVGVAGHRRQIVGQDQPALDGGPFQHSPIVGSIEVVDVLGANDIEGGEASQEATQDPAVEIFIREKAKHPDTWAVGAGSGAARAIHR